ARIVTDFPEPDSPMMQSTSPGGISKDTPLTACTVASRLTNFTVRSFTSTSGVVCVAAGTLGSAPDVVSCITIARLCQGLATTIVRSGMAASGGRPPRLWPEEAFSMWQAARCDERSTQAPIAGILAAHTSSANGQRVRKRQPEGGLIGLGGSPVSGASSTR